MEKTIAVKRDKPSKVKWIVLASIVAIYIFIAFVGHTIFLGMGRKWLLYYDRGYEARIVDAEKGEPVEGALAVALWELDMIPGEGYAGYAKIIVGTTDKEGAVKFPGWIGFSPFMFFAATDDNAPRIVFYKPGYKVERRLGEGVHKEIPLKLTRVFTDEEIWKNHKEFRIDADFPSGTHYSKKQLSLILSHIKKVINQLSNEISSSKQLIMKDIETDRAYWVEGKR
ncbi:MAG: hypothetical protein RQ824_05295 [bacterium]|nr:hypothetical protein [bacterium]